MIISIDHRVGSSAPNVGSYIAKHDNKSACKLAATVAKNTFDANLVWGPVEADLCPDNFGPEGYRAIEMRKARQFVANIVEIC